MGLLTAPFEKRATLANPDAFLSRWFGSKPTLSGADVNHDSALTFIPFYAANLVLSESVGQLPWGVFRDSATGSQPLRDHPLWPLLHDEANPEMSAIDWRTTAQGHLGTWGNHYSQTVRDGGGRPRELWPLLPNRMSVERSSDRRELKYTYRQPDGKPKEFRKDQILHIRGFGFDGLMGYSPVTLAREALGLGMATESFGASFFGNGAAPGGALQHPGTLNPEAHKRLRESFEDRHKGVANAHRPLILEEGMAWNQIGIPPEDSQFLETRKFQVNEIARLYRIPPHMLMDLERATFSNIEHQGIEFVVHTLLPWLLRWEQGVRRQLLTPSEKSAGITTKMNVEGFLRGDTESRYKSYAIGRQNGWLTVNDILRLENMNTIGPEGDSRLQPANMMPLGTVATPEPPTAQRVNGAALH